MEWVECIGKAIDYMEAHLTDEMTMEEIAGQVAMSPFYFQKGFTMLCGFTVGEYIKQRRLSLAGSELVSTKERIIDIAMKYGYDSPDSFTKAFTRFHGTTPSSVRREGAAMKSFAPLRLHFSLEGGYLLDYRIVEKKEISVIGISRIFQYESAQLTVPQYWQEYHRKGYVNQVCGTYGISIDEKMGGNEFEYMIADTYKPSMQIPEGFLVKTIPAHTWAVFTSKGAMPEALQEIQKRIFSEWLPGCVEYEIAAGYNIEKYTDPADYPKGTRDEEYICEIWIPIKKSSS